MSIPEQLSQLLNVFSLNSDILEATLRAMSDPSSNNIQEVVNSYARNYQTPPLKLMTYLIKENRTRYPGDTYIARMAPWGIAAALILALVIFR